MLVTRVSKSDCCELDLPLNLLFGYIRLLSRVTTGGRPLHCLMVGMWKRGPGSPQWILRRRRFLLTPRHEYRIVQTTTCSVTPELRTSTSHVRGAVALSALRTAWLWRRATLDKFHSCLDARRTTERLFLPLRPQLSLPNYGLAQ